MSREHAWQRDLDKADLSADFWIGKLRRFHPGLGRTVELARWLQWRRAPSSVPRVDVLVAGFEHRSGITALTQLFADLRRAGRTFHVVRHDDVFGRHARRFRELGVESLSIEAFVRASDHRRSIVHPVAEWLGRHLDATHPELHWNYRRWTIKNAIGVWRLLDRCRPSCLVIPDETQPLATAVALLAEAQTIPLISLPEVQDQLRMTFGRPRRFRAQQTWVYSEAMRGFYARAGVPAETLCVATSSDFFSANLRHPPGDARALRGRAGWPAEGKIVLFACQAWRMNRRLFEGPMQIARENAGLHWVFRPHPQQSERLLGRLLRGATVTGALSAFESIDAADLVVSHSSLHLAHALRRGKPVVIWNPGGPCPVPFLAEQRGARFASTPDELRRAIAASLDAPRSSDVEQHLVEDRGIAEASRPR